MPIKQVVCCVCNKTVNKAQTLSIGEGKRACRIHEEIDEQSKQAQKKLQEESEQQKEKNRRRNTSLKDQFFDPRPTCFSCCRRGLRQDEFFLEMLKCSEKYEIIHGKPANPFDAKESKAVYEFLKGSLCLWVIKYEPKMKMDEHARVIAEMTGLTLLCSECCDRQKIKYGLTQTASQMNFKQLANASVVYEAIVKPEIRKLVEEEIKSTS